MSIKTFEEYETDSNDKANKYDFLDAIDLVIDSGVYTETDDLFLRQLFYIVLREFGDKISLDDLNKLMKNDKCLTRYGQPDRLRRLLDEVWWNEFIYK